jgi:hypothetical protein
MSETPAPPPGSPPPGGNPGERLVLGDVNRVTGNVAFDGFVRVSGDVTDGMFVSGLKGVQIMGSVRNGRVLSEADVTIFGDVIGGEETLISAKGRIIVRNVENATLVAESIVCNGSIRKSRLEAQSIIHADDGEGGEITFTRCRVGKKLIANILGASGDRETIIEVEQTEKSRIMKTLLAAEEELRAAQAEFEKLHRVVQMVKIMGEKVRTLSEEMQMDLKEKLRRVVELQEVMRMSEDRRSKLTMILEEMATKEVAEPVEVKKKVIRGVKITIDGATLEVPESLLHGAVFYKKKRVLFRST